MLQRAMLLKHFGYFSVTSQQIRRKYFKADMLIKDFPKVDHHERITRESFDKLYYEKKPVLITKGLNWNAFNRWSFKYFEELFDNVPASLFRFDLENNYARQRLDGFTVGEAMRLMQTNSSPRFKYYLIRQSITDYFPELLADIQFPDWCKFPARLDTNVWIGDCGSNTVLHYDASENFLIQVQGEKEVVLLPQKNNFFQRNSPLMGGRFNFSSVKFLENIDLKVLEANSKNAFCCTLKPGMALYIPVGWWHQVKTTERSISINYFFPEKKLDNRYKHFITDYQLTSLNNEIYSREISQLLKDCTYDNCLETAKKLSDLSCQLALIVCGAFLEELLIAFQRLYLKSGNEENSSLTNIINQLLQFDHSRFFASETQLNAWQCILQKKLEENNTFTQTETLSIIQSVEVYFQQTTQKEDFSNTTEGPFENKLYPRL